MAVSFRLAPDAMTRRAAYWTCQLTGWTLYGVGNLVLGAAFGGLTAAAALFTTGIAALGLSATHGLRAVIRRRGWLGLPVGRLAARVALASVATAALMVGVVTAALMLVGVVTGPDASAAAFGVPTPDAAAPGVPLQGLVLLAFANWSFLVVGWSALYVGVHLVERWRGAERARADAEAARATAEAERAQAEAERWRLQSAVAEAELRALQAQVHPHFLFNSLNSVRTLVAEDPGRAEQAVTDLADLLRYALAVGRRPTVPLRDELDAVQAYLALETLRFEHRLAASVEADAQALDVRVPPFVVQTLVENGVKHGVSQRPEGGVLRVRAAAQAGAVRVTVESTGRYEPDGGPTDGAGLGLANASDRLGRLCPGATLTVRQSGPDTVTAEVVLPTPHASRRANAITASAIPAEAAR